MLPPAEIFPKFFQELLGRLPAPWYLGLRRNFSKIFSRTFWDDDDDDEDDDPQSPSKMAIMLGREKIFPKNFSQNFGKFDRDL